MIDLIAFLLNRLPADKRHAMLLNSADCAAFLALPPGQRRQRINEDVFLLAARLAALAPESDLPGELRQAIDRGATEVAGLREELAACGKALASERMKLDHINRVLRGQPAERPVVVDSPIDMLREDV